MFFLSRQTVRSHRSLYAGSFVALAVGVFLLGLAATATAATSAYDGPPGERITVNLPATEGSPPHQVRVPMSDTDVSGLQTVLSLVGMISGFITIFVIASTFAFAVDDAEGIDPAVAARTRNLEAITGAIDQLTGKSVAISKELAGFEHYRVGDQFSVTFTDRTTDRLRVVAILKDAPGINPALLIPIELARQHDPAAKPSQWFVMPAEGVDSATLIKALDVQLAGTGADAVRADEWEAAQGKGVRHGNRLGLILLLGPAALYSAIAIANTLLMGSLQRRHEFVTSRLLGATPAQIRRMVLWESSLVGAVALSLGAAITVTVGLLIRNAMTDGMVDVPATVPWVTLLSIAAVCLALAVGSALAPTTFILRRSHPSGAVE